VSSNRVLDSSLALTTKSAAGFRCILLIAGLHFRSRTQNLDYFERVIIQQKVQCIQEINENLSDQPSTQDAGVISMIATLCMVEVSPAQPSSNLSQKTSPESDFDQSQAKLGNIQASNAHLAGLMTLLESRHRANSRLGLVDARITTDVLLQRYVLACIRELIDHKEKLRLTQGGWESVTTAGWAAALGESAWIEDWLKALCVMPSCIAVPDDEENRMADFDSEIDARDTIRALRILTARCDVRHFPLEESPPGLMAVNKLWVIRGGKHKSFFSIPIQIRPGSSSSSFSTGSLQSALDISDAFPSASQKFRTPWAAFAICSSIYMHTALYLWKLDKSVDSQGGGLTRWLVSIVQADLERTWPSVASGRRSRELWLWRLFVTTTHVEVLQMRDKDTSQKSHYRNLRAWCHGRIRLWCDFAGVREWDEVKAALVQIAWPEDSPLEPFAESVWNAALA
jgi:hypothetical protein